MVLKGAEAAFEGSGEGMWLNHKIDVETGGLEYGGGRGNGWCSGAMQRYHAAPRLRRQPAKPGLTLMHESVGSEQD